MTDNQLLNNQTRFSDEGMFFESPPPAPDMGPKPPFLETKQGKLTLIGLAVLGFILIVVGLAALATNQQVSEEKQPDYTPQPARELTETEKKVEVLRQLLKTADPTKEVDPFPPVDLTFRLDEAD